LMFQVRRVPPSLLEEVELPIPIRIQSKANVQDVPVSSSVSSVVFVR